MIEIILWEESVLENQECGIELLNVRKHQIAICTSKEQLSIMKAQTEGVRLYAQKQKLESLDQTMIDLWSRITLKEAELTPAQPGKRTDTTSDNGVRGSNSEQQRNSRTRAYASRWKTDAEHEKDIAAMYAGDKKAKERLSRKTPIPPEKIPKDAKSKQKLPTAQTTYLMNSLIVEFRAFLIKLKAGYERGDFPEDERSELFDNLGKIADTIREVQNLMRPSTPDLRIVK